ncbi:MAG: hypothetical protein Q9221_001278 [Calogaya cf. arnoldii]
MPDLTRFARNPRSSTIAQAIGLPLALTLTYVLGVTLAATSQVLYGGDTILTDYYLVRHTSGYNVCQLYAPKGLYWYSHGVNWRAIVAFFGGMLPLLPGLIHQINPDIGGISHGYLNFSSLAWLDSTILASISYYILSIVKPFPKRTDTEDEIAWAIHRQEVNDPVSQSSPSESGENSVMKAE